MTEHYPQTNKFSESNIPPEEMSPDFQQKPPQKPDLPRWVIVLIVLGIIVFIGMVGYVFYQKTSSSTPSSVIDKTTKIEKIEETEESTPSKSAPSEKAPESLPATKIVDCGNTQFDLLDQNLNPEDNSTLACLGSNFLSNCQAARAVVNNNEIVIKGGNLTECKITLPTAEELMVDMAEVKKMVQVDNKKPEEYPGTVARNILAAKALSVDNRIKYTELLDKNFMAYAEKNLALSLDKGLENLGHCQHDLYALEDECDLFFSNSARDRVFDLDLEKVNYQMADQNNFDLSKAVSRAEERFNYLHSLKLNIHKEDSKALSFQNIDIDEYKVYKEFFGSKDILVRKGSWIIEISYSQEIEDQKIVKIVSYLANKI